MSILVAIKKDLIFLKDRFEMNPILAFFFNRGFHALLTYRISNLLFKVHIPILPMIFTRIVQVLYAIDIDYKCELKGGIVIIHGVGLVIGQGAKIGSGTVIYHGVTLGRKRQTAKVDDHDGFPDVQNNCVLGAGCKLIGKIIIGKSCIIGPNVVVSNNVPDFCQLKVAEAVTIQHKSKN